MTTTLAPSPLFKAFDNNGQVLANGQLLSFAAGTSTPIATYADSTGTVNPNPLILNNRGEGPLWLQPNVAYKLTLTDSQGNLLWSVDQIVNSQLITLYGGVDTGVANAYVINFTSNFTSYTDGVIVYWIPANSNTTASTININGLGVIALVNQNGSPLLSGQIIANTVVSVMIKGGQALLLSGNIANAVLAVPGTPSVPSIAFAAEPQTGFYRSSAGEWAWVLNGVASGGITTGAATWNVTGLASPATISIPYSVSMQTTTLFIAGLSGTSNSTNFSITLPLGAPTGLLAPLGGVSQWISIPVAQDNGTNLFAQVASIAPSGFNTTITFYKNGVAAGWTNSGTKSIGATTGSPVAISYFNGGGP